ncbi:hypothetical protein B484DRAFT_444442 [Ochromonadaceae sp. CCMP2298]|nr:hypothetical protein B484DRAFT_444442 [Ochromonadaceae sp. CCMP2298]
MKKLKASVDDNGRELQKVTVFVYILIYTYVYIHISANTFTRESIHVSMHLCSYTYTLC